MPRYICLVLLSCLLFPAFAADDPEERRARLEYKLEKYQDRLAYAQSDEERFYPLNDIAKLSFELDDLEAAERFAQQALAVAREFPDDWNYGNAIHDGNMVLGRLALARGDVDEARSRLLRAGRTPGSPQLDTFGPNVSLARDLLDVGERETVLEYFRLCREFWDSERRPLDRWVVIVEQGGRPEFGANLYF